MKRKFYYRTKLLVFILFIITLFFLAVTYTSVSLNQLSSETQDLMVSSQQLMQVYDQIRMVQDDMETYLISKTSEDLTKFYDSSNTVSISNEALKENASYTPKGVQIKNLSSMLDQYLDELDATVFAKRNEITDEYIRGSQITQEENELIENYIQQIMSDDLRSNAEIYTELQQETERNNTINSLMLILVLVFAVLGTLLFSYQITQPLSQLAGYANSISHGDYKVDIDEDDSSIEMNALYDAFGQMANNVRRHVGEMKEKQKLEKKLAAAEIDSLKMEASLKEAELLALQYQVNPHFIFNTINIGAKIAMLQGDKVTCEYLENTAEVFRYNLRSSNVDVTLEEELLNVQSYLTLLKTRFGDMLQIQVEIPGESDILNFRMPPLVLQPLAENAYIHGASKQENGGDITISVNAYEDAININISNTGPPVPEDTITRILNGTFDNIANAEKKGHTNNIGIGNVLKRLRLYFGVDDILSIVCAGGRTNVILRLPNRKDAETDV